MMNTTFRILLLISIFTANICFGETAKAQKSPREVTIEFIGKIVNYGKSQDSKIADSLKSMMVETTDESADKMFKKFLDERFVKQSPSIVVKEQIFEKDGVAVCVIVATTDFGSVDVDPFVLIKSKSDNQWHVAGNSKVGLKSKNLDDRANVLKELMEIYNAKHNEILEESRK